MASRLCVGWNYGSPGSGCWKHVVPATELLHGSAVSSQAFSRGGTQCEILGCVLSIVAAALIPRYLTSCAALHCSSRTQLGSASAHNGFARQPPQAVFMRSGLASLIVLSCDSIAGSFISYESYNTTAEVHGSSLLSVGERMADAEVDARWDVQKAAWPWTRAGPAEAMCMHSTRMTRQHGHQCHCRGALTAGARPCHHMHVGSAP